VSSQKTKNTPVNEYWKGVYTLGIGHFVDASLSRPDRAILLYSILLLCDLYWPEYRWWVEVLPSLHAH